MDRFWEYINGSQTHECGGAEAALFPEKEHLNGIAVAVQMETVPRVSYQSLIG